MNDGSHYCQDERPEPSDLLAVPPFEVGVEYQPACGTTGFLVDAQRVVTEAKP